jgi:hypothetical protein
VTAPSLDGGCACGAVRYRLAAPPIFVHACHCTECRGTTREPYAVNAAMETGRIAVTRGAPKRVVLPRPGKQDQATAACEGCGTVLWSHHPFFGDRIAFIRVATLDEVEKFPPLIHCFTSSKLPGTVIPADAMAFEGTYNPYEQWPAESIARLKAAVGVGRSQS